MYNRQNLTLDRTKFFIMLLTILLVVGLLFSAWQMSQLYRHSLQSSHEEKLNAQITNYANSIKTAASASFNLLNQIESYAEKNVIAQSIENQSYSARTRGNVERILAQLTEVNDVIENIGITLENQSPFIYPPVFAKQDIRLNRFVTAALERQTPSSDQQTHQLSVDLFPARRLIDGRMIARAQQSIYQDKQRVAILFLELNILKLIENSGLTTSYNDLAFEIQDQTKQRIYSNDLMTESYTITQTFNVANAQWTINAACKISNAHINQKVTIFNFSLVCLLLLLIALIKIYHKRVLGHLSFSTQSGFNQLLETDDENHTSSASCLLPIVITAAVSLAFIGLYLLLDNSEKNIQREQLLHTGAILKSNVSQKLSADKDYLLLITEQIAHGRINQRDFHQRLSQYLHEHPRLSNISWMSADFKLLDSVDRTKETESNQLQLPSKASARAFKLSQLTAQPTYSAPFNHIHNQTSFELYLPIFQQQRFIGALKANYPLEDLLRQEVIRNTLALYQVTFLDSLSKPLWVFDSTKKAISLEATFPLDSLNQLIWFKLANYDNNNSTHRVVLAFMFVLGIAISFFFWWQYRINHQYWLNNQSLRNSFEHFQNIAKASPMAILITSTETGRITFANDKAGALFDFPPKAMIDIEIIKLYWDPREQANKLSLFDEKGYIESFELRVRRRDNSYFWASISSKIIQHQNQKMIISSIIDLSEQKQQENKLIKQANYDSLTGLANRSLALERLQYAIAGAQRRNQSVALMMLDLDNFKQVNDSLGHNYGDLLLQEIANKLQQCFRQTDTVARLGGDEFTFILPELDDLSSVDHIAQKVLALCEKPLYLQGQEVRISASIGISIYPKDGSTQQSLLKNADIAMYKCKEQGKNNYRYYDQQMSEQAESRMRMELQIRRAIGNNEFSLHYQPLICVKTRRIRGAEALLRWNNDQLGQVPPDVFIPLAENIGLIDEIGHWVLRQACQQAKIWHDQKNMPQFIAVNVSSHQLRNDHFIDTVKSVLAEYSLPAHALELELTESTLLENTELNSQKLKEINALGVKLSIDDFGTGYSSLSYLQRFSFDTLKIDRSFIQNINNDPKAVQIVSAILSMAKVLNLKVVAEGVEDKQQLALLTELDCPIVQGYYFARPTVAQAIEAREKY